MRLVLFDATVVDTVAADTVTESNTRQVVPESVVRKILICAAADVAASFTTNSNTLVPPVAPEITSVIVPVPSIAVFAVAVLAIAIRGVLMNCGEVAMDHTNWVAR